MHIWICTLSIYLLSTLENTYENNVFFCLFTTSILAKLSTSRFEHSGDISCSLLVTRATLMSPRQNETRVSGYIYILYIYDIYNIYNDKYMIYIMIYIYIYIQDNQILFHQPIFFLI